MGQLGSRHGSRRNNPDLDISNAAYRYPARSGGNYFGSHFVLGLERFEFAQPEAYLFGENSDLNFLCAKPVQFPYPMLPTNKPCKPLYCSVVIRRDSLKFVRLLNNSSSNNNDRASTSGDESDDVVRYNIEFIFDSDYPCTITVYYYASEQYGNQNVAYLSKRPELTSRSYRYGVGAGQLFRPRDLVFHTSLHEMDQLHCDSASDIIPVVIHAVADPIDPRASDAYTQSHALLASVDRSAEGQGYILKVLRQKQFVDGVCYTIQEIYGIENKHGAASFTQCVDEQHTEENTDCPPDQDDSGESSGECIVCMSELRDTLILPCRHLCICSSCAETLRYKASNCPICRSPFRVLLQIKAVRKKSFVDGLSGRESVTSQRYAFINDRAPSDRYELEPLMCALNGPSGCSASAVTLPCLPSRSFVVGASTSSGRRHRPATSAQPILVGGGTSNAALSMTSLAASASHRSYRAPRPPPRRGHKRKKHAKVPPPIQEVLTPQNLTSKSCEKIEMTVRNSGLLNVDETKNTSGDNQVLSDEPEYSEISSPSGVAVEDCRIYASNNSGDRLGSSINRKHVATCEGSPAISAHNRGNEEDDDDENDNDEDDEDLSADFSPGVTVTIDFEAEEGEEELRSISSQENFEDAASQIKQDEPPRVFVPIDDEINDFKAIRLLQKIDNNDLRDENVCLNEENAIKDLNATAFKLDNGEKREMQQLQQCSSLDETALSSVSSASNSSNKPLLSVDNASVPT